MTFHGVIDGNLSLLWVPLFFRLPYEGDKPMEPELLVRPVAGRKYFTPFLEGVRLFDRVLVSVNLD